MTLTIEIEEIKKRSLEKLARENGKQTGEFVKDIINEYLRQNRAEIEEISGMMKLSETSFGEWDNEEDAIYDTI